MVKKFKKALIQSDPYLGEIPIILKAELVMRRTNGISYASSSNIQQKKVIHFLKPSATKIPLGWAHK